ncbi:MAG: SDR family oxidoreductase [Sphingobacteriales bacterium JAD_PAG50586_3]|nr:MAG: SDR family oxidoreductase [Sphingobacteriales bacterium JAD_PAG50586_3]
MKDKVIWITGASSGIGEALVYELAKQGARLVLSARNEKELERVATATSLGERDVFVLPLDLEKPAEMQGKAAQVMNHFGRIDILINNGGLSQRSLAKDTGWEVDQRLLNVNVVGTIALTKAVLPYFLRQKQGRYVTVTSLVGKFGSPMRSGYSAAKHALHGFFDSLRAEVEKDGIAVTLVCPGFVQTNVSLNAVTGNGTAQNKMDDATANGITAQYCAQQLIKAINNNKREVYIGNKETYGVLLKRFFPGVFANMIGKAKVT